LEIQSPKFKFTRDVAKGLGLTLPEPQKEYSMENDKVLFEYEARKGVRKED